MMNNYSRFALSSLVLCAGAIISPQARAIELIVNGGFETGDFTGWTATNNGIGELTPWTVSGPGGGYFFNTAPLAGFFDAYNGFDGDAGLVYELYQDIVIPAGFSATLSSNHRIVYDSLFIFSTLDRIFEISIRDTSNVVLSTLYSQSVTMNGAPYTDLGWNSQSFDISAFAGSTVRVHFREFIPEFFTGPANLELDNISVDIVPIPEPAAGVLAALACLSGITARRARRNLRRADC